MKASAVLSVFFAAVISASLLPPAIRLATAVEKVEITGPVKNVFSEASVIKRDLDTQELEKAEAVKKDERRDEMDIDKFYASNNLDKRAKEGKTNCRWGGSGSAATLAIRDGIDYIKDNWFGSDCVVEAGPSKCQRFTCSWDSAIWLCNDTKKKIKVPCRYAAYSAEKIIDKCGWYDWEPRVQGQRFHNQDWNVIVGKDSC
ncbi:hypothetical protein B0J13DRAFT_648034 [Dactylonectria estremocensis]|uniref:Secreted protein n=1 Tax=Dactylonectria estremocensis TaxID=1079267 RepID=A0A9P9IK63_9HYPO|nr:hypothetical protein B0J13DRAFT_648034 [Dactylonectria estremocensis]